MSIEFGSSNTATTNTNARNYASNFEFRAKMSISLGLNSDASGDGSICIGSNSKVNGVNSIVIGNDNDVEGDNCVVVGNGKVIRGNGINNVDSAVPITELIYNSLREITRTQPIVVSTSTHLV